MVSGAPGYTNVSVNNTLNYTGPLHHSGAVMSATWYTSFLYLLIGIVVIYVIYKLLKEAIRKSKGQHKVKPVSRILHEEQINDTESGGIQPLNATFCLNKKELFKVYFCDPAYVVPKVQVPVAIREPNTDRDKKDKHRKHVTISKKTIHKPLLVWYLRVKPINTIFQRVFHRFVKNQFFKIAKRKIDAEWNPNNGELEYIATNETVFFSAIGTTKFDREYAGQLRENNLDTAYWKAEDLGSLAIFADASQQKVIGFNQGHAAALNRIEREYEGKGDVEEKKKYQNNYG